MNEPITTSDEIIKEFEYVLSKENNKDNCLLLNEYHIPFDMEDKVISLYDLANFIIFFNNKYISEKEQYMNYFNDIAKSNFNLTMERCEFDSKYNRDILFTTFENVNGHHSIMERMKVVFKKNNGDLYILESDIPNLSGKILLYMGDKLSQLFDIEKIIQDLDLQGYFYINIVNGKFKVNIKSSEVSIIYTNPQDEYINDFNLSLTEKGYNYNCNSSKVLSFIRGKEEEIFRRTFVKIEDCPEYIQKDLYEIKNNPTTIQKPLQGKKEKILQLTKKLLPFIKN